MGAGAAGLAAARCAVAAGLEVVLLEARPHVGGRCVTAMTGGHPIDLGAHWLHAGEVNPLVRIALDRREPVRRAPQGPYLVKRGRFAPRATRDAHARGFDRVDRAIARAAAGERDVSIAACLPPLGPWRASLASTFALISGRPLDEVSAWDFPSDEFGDNWFVRGGYGAFLGRLARDLPVVTGAPVTRLVRDAGGVTLATPLGEVRARAAIVTVSMPVLAAGAIAFAPALPEATRSAIASFRPGSYDHVVINWPGSPFRKPDRLAKLIGRGPKSIFGLMVGIDRAPFHYLEFGHGDGPRHGRRAGMARRARTVLLEHFGAAALRRIRILHVTDWTSDPWSRCAWAVLPPGCADSRALVSDPVDGRLWFAGEANSHAMWGTVGGAWQEGERAAAEAGEALGRA